MPGRRLRLGSMWHNNQRAWAGAQNLLFNSSRPYYPFGAPWWPFWIFEVLILGIIESKGPITKCLTSLHTPSAILGVPGDYFEFNRHVALQAVQHWRRWVSAQGATRLIFQPKTFLIQPTQKSYFYQPKIDLINLIWKTCSTWFWSTWFGLSWFD